MNLSLVGCYAITDKSNGIFSKENIHHLSRIHLTLYRYQNFSQHFKNNLTLYQCTYVVMYIYSTSITNVCTYVHCYTGH